MCFCVSLRTEERVRKGEQSMLDAKLEVAGGGREDCADERRELVSVVVG